MLLRNDGTLPLDRGALGTVAVLGRLADTPNTGDKGSSQVIAPDVVTPLAGLRARWTASRCAPASTTPRSPPAPTWRSSWSGSPPPTRASSSTRPARPSWATCSHRWTVRSIHRPRRRTTTRSCGDEATFGAGGDRRSLALHAEDEALIARRAVCDQVVVVVMGGSAVLLPWIDDVAAVLHIWYPGMEGGHAWPTCCSGPSSPAVACRS
ncbi:MAG: glycoside hydrolase family 3 C-terminal domain-containing protein [Acidimicrobiales bacterium]